MPSGRVRHEGIAQQGGVGASRKEGDVGQAQLVTQAFDHRVQVFFIGPSQLFVPAVILTLIPQDSDDLYVFGLLSFSVFNFLNRATICQSVDVGRNRNLVAVATQRRTQIIDRDEQHVQSIVRGCRAARNSEKHARDCQHWSRHHLPLLPFQGTSS